eukprot:TRINITY_DN597_c0_g1_i1.p1 TRINITY_DN597_c0_g1~~TRINITY_DN597_c0_g1_i1.p1  ORF type:complete len:281 (+),score=90.31 TRINITY_DN597_c0_g1_i1:61-903(+)
MLQRVLFSTRFAPKRFFSASTAEAFLEPLSGADAGITVLNLNRPSARNALGKRFMNEFSQALTQLQYDKSTRVVIVRSMVPGVFCAGADLKERATMSEVEVSAFVNLLRSSFTQLQDLGQPTIAAIDGAAFGGGLEMALACDLRTAGEQAKMGLVETSLAIIPGAGGTQRLTRLIGLPKAKELIFTSRRISAQEALQLGIVNAVSQSGYESALQLAREILPNGPVALRMAKRAMDLGYGVDLNSGMSVEQLCYAQIIPTKDRIEGLTAFKEKRKPAYKGE